MAKLIVRRIIWTIPVLLLVVFLTFILMKAIPGGPFTGEKALPPEILANMNAKYGLDAPWYEQYLRYIWRALHGDLGVSMTQKSRTVLDIISDAFPVSLHLGIMAFGLGIIIGVPAGIVAALKHNTWADYAAIFYATLGWAVPNFIVGPILIYIFAVKLGWLPTSTWHGWQYWVLPTVTLGTALSAYFARLTRGSMLETLQQDYVRTALAKGLPYRTVVVKHVLRNSLIPVITQAGPLLGFVITGCFLVEFRFSVPGMDKYQYREYELNQEAAGDNKAQKRTSLGDNGYQGVAKNMLHHNCSVGKSFGKRRPHIVLLQSLQHASSGEPCEIRGQGGPQRNRGQHPILPPMPRGCGKPTQFHGEDVYQDRADDEVRHRPSQGGIEYRGVVSPRVVLQRRHYTGGHTNNDPQPKSHDPQVQADRERITDDVQHSPALLGHGHTQISVERAPYVPQVLLIPGCVQAILGVHVGQDLRR